MAKSKKYKRNKKIIRFLKIFIVVIIILSIIAIISIDLLFPSYLSYISACHPQGEEIINDLGYQVAGLTQVGTGTKMLENGENVNVIDTSNITITYPEGKVVSKRTYRHEIIHLNQAKYRGWIVGCDKPKEKMVKELEAYTFSLLPDWAFVMFYELG
jgi:hypothetical protein